MPTWNSRLEDGLMNALTITLSSDAAAWIMKKLQIADNKPELSGLAPGLYYFLDEQRKDEAGRVFEWCPHPFFDIGWDRPETTAANGFIEVEINGMKLFVSLATLDRLRDKHLILGTVEVGYPAPGDKKRTLLREVPREM
jgi:hypothetical protein